MVPLRSANAPIFALTVGGCEMTRVATLALLGVMGISVTAQAPLPVAVKPQLTSVEWLKNLDRFDGQVVELSVLARHLGSQRVFTFGEKEGREVRVLIPNPAVDTANVGDVVTIVGTVRHFDAKVFAAEYRWFQEADYPGIPNGELIVVASSVRSPDRGDLLPGNGVTAAQGRKR
jgi:hypothetical protein